MGFVSVLFFPFLVSNNFSGKLDAHLLVFVHWVVDGGAVGCDLQADEQVSI